jgi:hypothetical protein
MQNTQTHDPADDAIGGDLRDEIYEDLHEDETPERAAERCEHEAYVEAAHKLLPVILGTLNYVIEGRGPNDILFRLAVVSHYFGHPTYAGKSMAEICDSFGKTRAAGSHASLKFQRSNHLPELLGQKSQETRTVYHDRRRTTVLCKSN